MATTNLAGRIVLRPVVLPDDEDFLIKLYFTTRDDINFLPLEEAQKKSILMMQYQAQKQQYEEQFPDSRHDIILLDGESVGRFWTMREETEIRGIDLALLPEYRNSGIGSHLLAEIFEEAAQTNRDFTFHVLKTNPAMQLYQRLGCEFTGETVSHFQMRRRPENK
jgi:ribosomal protein S18 acetylase RimI-like enzyme